MFDKLTGKKELENHIRSLEAQIEQLNREKDSLAARMASREDGARRAVAQKQEVERELNNAKKKIESLEHEISSLRKADTETISFRNIGTLFNQSMTRYIFQIGSIRSPDPGLITAYLPPGTSINEMENNERLTQYLDPGALSLIGKIDSPTGMVIFYDTGGVVMELISPFLPVDVSAWKIDTEFDTVPLQELIKKEVTLCLMIVHAGESFIGITDSPDSFKSHQIIRSNVKSKHTKGGWSQRRFERLRDEDIMHHVDKVKQAFKLLTDGSTGGSGEEIDLIMTGGEARLIQEILKGSGLPVVDRRFDVTVDKRNIDKILKDAWSSKRYWL